MFCLPLISTAGMNVRADIQGLRAVAFFLVFVFHLNPKWLPGGFIGVDIFFVISGFLMTSIILGQKATGSFSFLTFYERRVKRIVPALFFMLLLIALAAYYLYIPADINGLTRSLRRSFLFLSNLYFSEDNAYFGSRFAQNPVLHTWSLSIEMQFYLLLPLLLRFVKNSFLPGLVAALIIVLTGLSCYWLYGQEQATTVYFSLTARIPEFLIGVLTSLLFSGKTFSGRAGLCLCAVGMAGIVASALLIDEQTSFPGVIALVPCVSIGLILISGGNVLGDLLSSRPFVYIGERSYSLYLWHWPVIAFLRYKSGWSTVQDFSLSELLFILLATTVLAGFSYHLVEKVFRNMPVKKGIRYFAPILLLLVAFLVLFPRVKSNMQIPPRYAGTTYGKHLQPDDYVESLGDTSARGDRIFLFGDSHALLIRYLMNEIGIARGFGFKTLTTYGFPAIKGIDRSQIPLETRSLFDTSRKVEDLTYECIENSDILVLGCIDFKRSSSMAQALEDLIAQMRPDQKLILFTTYPVLDRHPLKVNGGYRKKTDEPIQVVFNPEYSAFMEELDLKYEQVYRFDLSKSALFHKAPYHNGLVMYYDQMHLNLYGSELLLADIGDELTVFFETVMDDQWFSCLPDGV